MEAAMGQQTLEGEDKAFNEENGIIQTIRKALPVMGAEVEDLMAGAAGKGKGGGRRLVLVNQERRTDGIVKKYGLGLAHGILQIPLDNISQPDWVEAAHEALSEDDIEDASIDDSERANLIERLEKEMKQAAARLDFERGGAPEIKFIRFRPQNNVISNLNRLELP